MKLMFNQQPKYQSRNPFKAAGNMLLLLDDAIHSRVQKASEKIEEKTGIGKKGQARTILIASIPLKQLMEVDLDVIAKNMHVLGMITSVGLAATEFHCRLLIDPIVEKKQKMLGVISKFDLVNNLYQYLRGWILIGAAVAAGMERYSTSLGWLAVSLTLYLASSSNGMLEQMKQTFSELKNTVKSLLFPKPANANFCETNQHSE